jgi:hypothetical protein
MSDLTQLTAETLGVKDEVLKAVTSQGYNTTLGLTGYNLEAPAKLLVPVLSPFRNRVPRAMAPNGAAAAQWKAITGLNVTNASLFTPFGVAGNLVSTTEQDNLASYKAISLGDSVQMDAAALARGFDDLRARAGTNLLYSVMIAEDQMLLGAQNFALQTPGTPVVTVVASGGNIGTVAINVKVSARTLENYFTGGGTVLSAQGTATPGSGSTNSATVTVAAVAGAVAYDWYVGGYYYTTTTVNAATITSVPVADAAVANLPHLSGANISAASRASDLSADPNAFNGLLASVTGDYAANGGLVQRGSGTNSGAIFKSLDGAALTGLSGGVSEIDAVLQSLWDSSRISPTVLMANSQHIRDITRKVIATGGAYTLFQPDNVAERQGVVGGQILRTYLNPAVDAQPIEIVAQPNIPQGTIILGSERLPYPGNNVASVWEVETQQEYEQVEYAMSRGNAGAAWSGPRYDFEVRAIEVFKNYFPAGCAVISNVLAG